MGNSIAIIEVTGMATAIEVGDIAVKAANIELLGYELTRGAGLVVIKIRGDVGSVKAAVDAILSGAGTKKITHVVIPRPSEEVEKLLRLNVKVEDKKINSTKEIKKKEIIKEKPAIANKEKINKETKEAPIKKVVTKPLKKEKKDK